MLYNWDHNMLKLNDFSGLTTSPSIKLFGNDNTVVGTLPGEVLDGGEGNKIIGVPKYKANVEPVDPANIGF